MTCAITGDCERNMEGKEKCWRKFPRDNTAEQGLEDKQMLGRWTRENRERGNDRYKGKKSHGQS